MIRLDVGGPQRARCHARNRPFTRPEFSRLSRASRSFDPLIAVQCLRPLRLCSAPVSKRSLKSSCLWLLATSFPPRQANHSAALPKSRESEAAETLCEFPAKTRQPARYPIVRSSGADAQPPEAQNQTSILNLWNNLTAAALPVFGRDSRSSVPVNQLMFLGDRSACHIISPSFAKESRLHIRTIRLGSATLVQGIHERTLANGLIAVRAGARSYVGRPVPRPAYGRTASP